MSRLLGLALPALVACTTERYPSMPDPMRLPVQSVSIGGRTARSPSQ